MKIGMKIRLTWAVIGISAGLTAGTVFWISYQANPLNYNKLIIHKFRFQFPPPLRIIWPPQWPFSAPFALPICSSPIWRITSRGCSTGHRNAFKWRGQLVG